MAEIATCCRSWRISYATEKRHPSESLSRLPLGNDTLKQKFLRYETTVSRRCFVPSAESMLCGIFARNPPHHEAVH